MRTNKLHTPSISSSIASFFRVLLFFSLWIPAGVHLGGSPYFFGAYSAYPQVILPAFAFLALGFFAFAALSGGRRFFNAKNLLPRLFFFAILSLSGVFAANSSQSTLFLLLWGIGIMLMSTGKAWKITQTTLNGFCVSILCLSGFLYLSSSPNQLATGLTGAGAIIALAYIARTPRLALMGIYNLLCVWALVLTGNVLLLFLGLFLLTITPQLRQRYFRATFSAYQVYLPLAFGVLVALYWLFIGKITLPSLAMSFPHTLASWLLGYGTGNAMLAPPVILGLPAEATQLTLPSTGLGFLVLELGILGMLGFLVLLWHETTADKLKRYLILALVLLLPDFFIYEAGPIFLLGLLTLQIRPQVAERAPDSPVQNPLRSSRAFRLAVAAKPK